MTALLIIIPTICYILAAGVYAWHGNAPLAIVYAGYSFANVGLLWLDKIVKA